MKTILQLIFLLFSVNYFCQVIFEGNGFNHKQLLILNTDNSYKHKSLGQGYYDSLAKLTEIEGKYSIENNQIILFPEYILTSEIDFGKDSLNINNLLIETNKKIKEKKSISKTSEPTKYTILEYKNYQFLMQNDDLKRNEIKEMYLDFSDKLNQDNLYTKFYIIDKLHKNTNNNISKKELINMLPIEYKKYFINEPITFKILDYKEKKYRDPNVIESVSDEEAMLYEYNVILNKGYKENVHIGMKIYPQNDIKNCGYIFEIKKVDKFKTYGILYANGKCNLKINSFSTTYVQE